MSISDDKLYEALKHVHSKLQYWGNERMYRHALHDNMVSYGLKSGITTQDFNPFTTIKVSGPILRPGQKEKAQIQVWGYSGYEKGIIRVDKMMMIYISNKVDKEEILSKKYFFKVIDFFMGSKNKYHKSQYDNCSFWYINVADEIQMWKLKKKFRILELVDFE